MTRLIYHYARRTAGLIAAKCGLPQNQVRQVCCIATLAVHHGADLTTAVAAARRLANTLATEHTTMSGIERQLPLPAVRKCDNCRNQPRLYQQGGGAYFIECSPCQTRTRHCGEALAAIAEWEHGNTHAILCTRLSAAA